MVASHGPTPYIPPDDQIALVVRLVSCLRLTRYQTSDGQVFIVYALAADSRRRYQPTNPSLPSHYSKTIPQLAAAAPPPFRLCFFSSSSSSPYSISPSDSDDVVSPERHF